MLAWCEEAGAAAIPFGGGTSVVGGVEPPAGPADGEHRSQGDGSRARGGLGLARGADPGGGHRAAPGGAAARARTHAAALPAVVRVLDSGWLDRHARRRPLRDAVHPHRRLRRVGARAHAARLVGEPATAGLRGRAEPRPHADRLRGHPRRDHRGMDARAGRARASGNRRRSCSTRSRRARRRCARCRSRASTRRTAGCSTRARRRSPARRRTAGPARARLRVGRPRAGPWMARALELCADHGGRPRETARASPRAPGATPSSRRPTCATRSSPRASWPRPSRRRSRGTASTSLVGRVREGAREALGGRRARDLPAHPRLPGRGGALLHGARAGPPRRGARAVGGDEGGGVRGDRRCAAARSRTTTRSAATTGPGTTASVPSCSPQALRAAKSAVGPRGHPQSRRADRP